MKSYITSKDFEAAARAHAASRGADGTRYLYNHDLDGWLAHCRATGVDPSRPTLVAATAYRDKLQATIAPGTVRRTLSALSSMYAHAIEFEPELPRASCNPFRPGSLPRPPARSYTATEAIPDEVAQAVIAAARRRSTDISRRDVAVLLLMYETGLRVSSVTWLKRADLFRREGRLLARVMVKGAKEVEVEIPAVAEAALREWGACAPKSEFVFPSTDDPTVPISTKSVNKRLDRYAKAAGVGHVHPHQFRAAYATSALDAGVPLHEVQAAMHHENPQTTLRYDRGMRGGGVAEAVAKHRREKERSTNGGHDDHDGD